MLYGVFRGFAGRKRVFACLCALRCAGAVGCGGSHGYTNPPIVLAVSVDESPILIHQRATVYVPVMVMAPTETVTFAMNGLPAGVAASYRESESNPSGQLTLMANADAAVGTYSCTITVGSSGQMASSVVPLEVEAAKD